MKVYVNAFLHNNLGDDLFVDMLVDRYKKTKFVTISDLYKNDKMKIYSNKIVNKFLRRNPLKKILINSCDKIISIGRKYVYRR